MNVRTLVISVNVTTNAPTEDVLQGLREYIGSMDEVGAIGETMAIVKCEQVMAICEEDLSAPELIMWDAKLNGTLPKCCKCGKELPTVEDMWALDGEAGCKECANPDEDPRVFVMREAILLAKTAQEVNASWTDEQIQLLDDALQVGLGY